MFGKNKKASTDLEFYSVYDSKAQVYDLPALALNKESLLRDVLNMLRDPRQVRNKYLTNAEDYSIFRIGSFSKETGMITAQNPEHIVNMHELRSLTDWSPMSIQKDYEREIQNQDPRALSST